MFTGIVSDVGTVTGMEPVEAGRRLVIATAYDARTLLEGASVSCDGVCLTVTERGSGPEGDWFGAFAGLETLAVSTVGDWKVGRRINLERSLKAGDELGGHIVQGHVDSIATITGRQATGDQMRFEVEAPAELMPLIAKKGAITLNGTSLTINEAGAISFSVHLIPHTLEVTNWNERAIGDKVNLEVDPLARYAARLIEFHIQALDVRRG